MSATVIPFPGRLSPLPFRCTKCGRPDARGLCWTCRGILSGSIERAAARRGECSRCGVKVSPRETCFAHVRLEVIYCRGCGFELESERG